MERFNLFVPITKVDAAQRLVYGVITEEILDKAGEVLDYASSKPFFEKWSGDIAKATDGKSVGNIRAMHGKVAAGKLTQIEFDDAGRRVVGLGKIVDDNEWKKVEEGVYTGYSIGGDYVKRWADEATPTVKRYTANPAEISLVDNPCVPTAHFEYVKADGSTELRKFHAPEPEPVVEPSNKGDDFEQVWLCKRDGSTHPTKDALKKHMAKLDADAEAAKIGADANAALDQLEGAVKKVEGAAVNNDLRTAVLALDVSQHPARGTVLEALKVAPADLESVTKELDGEDFQKWLATDEGKAWLPVLGKKEEPTEPAAAKGPVRKGLYLVGCLADVLERICSLKTSQQYEQALEMDNDSELVGKFDAWLASGADLLRAMVIEETDELMGGEGIEVITAAASASALKAITALIDDHPTMEKLALDRGTVIDTTVLRTAIEKAGAKHGKADKESLQTAHDALSKMGVGCAGLDAGKVGARHSAADRERLDTAHNLLSEAGADCPMGKGHVHLPAVIEPGEDLTKAQAANEALGTLFKTMTDRVLDLVKRVEKIEAQPATAKGIRRITKTQDGIEGAGEGPKTPDQLEKEFMNLLATVPEGARANWMMKMALANGKVIAE